MEQDREEPSQSTQALPKINVILKGTSVRGDTSSGKKIALKTGLNNCSSAEPIARAYHFHSRRWRGGDLLPWGRTSDFHGFS